MAPSRLPVPNPLTSVWTAEPHPLDNYQSSPTLPSTCDVLIIGSGFSGIATAYHIFYQSSQNPPSTLILEARSHCSGATGRNGGHVKPDPYYNAPKYARLYGDAAARDLARWETEQVFAVKDLVEREGLDCDFHLTRSVDVYLEKQQADETVQAHREMVARGVVDARDVAVTVGKDAERISGVKNALCCISSTAAHLFPKKMVTQLFSLLLRRGLQAHAHTPVTSVSPTRDEHGFWTVNTPRGEVRARKIVFATNAYTSALLPQYSDKIVPVRGVCSHITSSLSSGSSSTKGSESNNNNNNHDSGLPYLSNTYCLRFGDLQYDYLIPRPDGSIVVGGARPTFLHGPREEWFDCGDDDRLTKGGSDRYFDGYMQRHFIGWEESGARTERVWSGIMGYSSDFLPHIGAVPSSSSSSSSSSSTGGQYILAGFSGHGMPQILLASRAIAQMVLGHDETTGEEGVVTFEQTGLPSILKTTSERLSKERRSDLEDGFRHLWEGEGKDVVIGRNGGKNDGGGEEMQSML